MSELANRAFKKYGELRPGRRVLSRPADLLARVEPVYRKLFAPHLPAQKDAPTLDVGSGYGEFLYFLQREGYEGAAGIEIDGDQVAAARRLGVRNLTAGDACQLLRESLGRFDFISAIDVLEHFPKDKCFELLELTYGAPRPGGRFLCQVPNAAAFYLPYFYMDFTHETPFAPASLKQALQMAGFANVLVSGIGPVVYGVKSGVRLVLWKLIEGCLHSIQIVEAGPGDDLRQVVTATIFAVAEKA